MNHQINQPIYIHPRLLRFLVRYKRISFITVLLMDGYSVSLLKIFAIRLILSLSFPPIPQRGW